MLARKTSRSFGSPKLRHGAAVPACPTACVPTSRRPSRVRLAFMAGHRAVLFVLPTGGGKTVVFSHIAEQAAARGNRIAVLVHRAELLDQACRSLAAMGVRHGVIAAGRSMNLAAPVQVASVQTLARRLAQLPADLFQLLVVDEAHHSNAGTWAKVIGHFERALLLGVTATPVRGDGRGLGEFYSALVLGPSAAWLSAEGYLAPARVFAPPLGFSVKGLRRRMGDFDLRQAAGELGGSRILGDAVSHYLSHLSGRTAIAFCCSIAHARPWRRPSRPGAWPRPRIDGSMDTLHAAALLEQLGSGALQVLTSCSLIGEGVDVPSVGGCILLRPTQSEALHLQMIGRCLRPQPGKQAVILDHVGNIEPPGPPPRGAPLEPGGKCASGSEHRPLGENLSPVLLRHGLSGTALPGMRPPVPAGAAPLVRWWPVNCRSSVPPSCSSAKPGNSASASSCTPPPWQS
jgi:DNA repair protein RadD